MCCAMGLMTAFACTAVSEKHRAQDAEYVAGVVEEAINEAGAENIVQVVMDGAAVCIAAGRILEDR